MEKAIPAAEAKTNFGALLEKVQREPLTISKKGRPVAVLMSMDEFETHQRLKLEQLRREVQCRACGAGSRQGGERRGRLRGHGSRTRRLIPRHNFTKRALSDLREIARYTRETWGLERARLYREELDLGIQKLALSPGMGRVRSDVAPSVRSFPIARHVAFYAEREGGITVLRLLHSSRDVARAFSDDESWGGTSHLATGIRQVGLA